MTTRTPTEETPCNLAFGTEAVIPVEVSLSSLRREPFDEKTNHKIRRLDFDYLDKIKDDALQRMMRYKQKMTKYHDQRVKLRRFNPGDLMLHRITEATKDPT